MYIIKLCGTKTAYCVHNESPRMKGTVSLAYIYAATLEQSGARMCWALTALHKYIVYRSDATHNFLEAPPPTAPLYVTIDHSYREWWTKIKGNSLIPKHHVLPVQYALQDHPERPRLWTKMIDKILTDNRCLSTSHTPCLYTAIIDDNKIYFLR